MNLLFLFPQPPTAPRDRDHHHFSEAQFPYWSDAGLRSPSCTLPVPVFLPTLVLAFPGCRQVSFSATWVLGIHPREIPGMVASSENLTSKCYQVVLPLFQKLKKKKKSSLHYPLSLFISIHTMP
jgi:hypothetical protein